MRRTLRGGIASAVVWGIISTALPAHADQPVAWMTGGGSVFTNGGVRVTHGFVLRCELAGPDEPVDPLEVNWDSGNHFHMDFVESVACTDDPKIRPNPPSANWDTINLWGTGRLNGDDDAVVNLVFKDAGEPGTKDTIRRLLIFDDEGNLVLVVKRKNLTEGNHQAHGNI